METFDVLRGGFTILVVIGLVVSAVGAASIETVDEGHVKVVKYKGEARGTFTPGDWYFINPATQSTVSINTRPQKMTFSDQPGEGEKNRDDSIKVITHDDVRVPVNLQVTYKVTDARQFYETWQTHENFRARVLYPGVEDGVLEVGGGTESTVIATDEGRSVMRKAAFDELQERAEGTGAVIMSVSIKKVNLPSDITHAAAQAQAMEQQKVAKQKEIEIAELEAERKLIEARGDKEAALERAEAYQHEGVIEAMYIEKLDETDTVYIPVGADGLPTHLDVNTDEDE
ncbi:SPFH domain-containing protein (plasmid) [Halorarum halophilum]|uniref:SPFH domain-containing protein n=1 Tax=Halorarum halophilum TaxID=2743090 RepID=A0A7D5KQC2_9EURY|nr:SPFH domain-containing protein [Halobaculum halophilum]QLG30142.1 SPFH domain-containing protein [Halobaculum halophilum]